jgi:hypothetical protein
VSEEDRTREEGRFCHNCGSQLPHEATNFCPNCGAAQTPRVEVPPDPPPEVPETGRISTPDAPGVPPPPQQSGRFSRTGLIVGGCATLLLLFLGLVACAAIIGGGGGEETTTESSVSEEKEEAKEEAKKKKGTASKEKQETTVAINQPVTVGDLEWTVIDAQRASRLSSEFLPAKEGNFVVADFNLLNQGNEAITFTSSSLSLQDSQGRTAEPDTDTFGYIEPERNILMEQLNPGVSRQGRVIFSVAPDASGFTLQVGDAAILSDENGYVDLGF